MLVVLIEERPAIAQIEITGSKEFDAKQLKEGLKQVGPGRIAHFRPRAARTGRTRVEEPVHQPRQVRRADHHDDHAARAQPGGPELRHLRGRGRQDPRHQRRRQQGVQGQGPDRRIRAAHAWLPDLVQQERPVLQAETAGRPGKPALLLPEPGLPRVHHRLHAGVDHAGQEGHLHHGQPDRRQEVQGRRNQACRRPHRARSRTHQTHQAEAGRSIFPRAPDRIDQADPGPARQ